MNHRKPRSQTVPVKYELSTDAVVLNRMWKRQNAKLPPLDLDKVFVADMLRLCAQLAGDE